VRTCALGTLVCYALVGQVELPPAVKWLLSLFAIAISFGLKDISSVLECLNMRGYMSVLAFHIVAPLLLAMLLLLAAASRMLCVRRFNADALLEKVVPTLLKLAFLAYPIVATVTFRKSPVLKRSQHTTYVPTHRASEIAVDSPHRCFLVLHIHRQ
jgi:hypothetical protein